MEILTVCILISIIAAFAIPSYMQARRVVYEDNAVSRLQRIALAESRFYTQYGKFGDFMDLVDASLLPEGYSTRFAYASPVTRSSVLPFIDRYSLAFFVPNTQNSLYYHVVAIPVSNNQMGLRTFNVNVFVTGTEHPDRLEAVPPVRFGTDINGEIVNLY
jgi:Tfp pilus assembly protein PilE